MSLLATDDFNRADSASLGSNWTDIDAGERITSNEATAAASNNIYSSRYTGVSAPNDQYSEVDVGSTVSASTDEGGGSGVRLQAGGNMYFLQGNTHETRNYKRVSGGYTQLGSDGGAIASTDVLYYEAQGSTLVTKKNTVAICGSPVSDSSIASGDFGTWTTRSGGGATSFNTWRGGDFSGGGGNTIAVPAGALTLSGQTPSVIATANNIVAVPAGALVLSGQTPSVVTTANNQIAVPLATLSLTGLAPTVLTPNVVLVPAGTLTLAGFAPLIINGNTIAIPLGTLALAGQVPTVLTTANMVIDVPLASLTLAAFTPIVIGDPTVISVGVGSSGGGGSYKRATKLRDKPNKHLKKILEDVETVYRELFDGDEPPEVAALIEPIVAAIKDPETIDFKKLEAEAAVVRKKLQAWAAMERKRQSDADDEWFLLSD